MEVGALAGLDSGEGKVNSMLRLKMFAGDKPSWDARSAAKKSFSRHVELLVRRMEVRALARLDGGESMVDSALNLKFVGFRSHSA